MRKLVLIATCILACTLVSRADNVFSTGFEAPTFQPGNLNGQGGFGNTDAGKVESGIANTGSQAVVFKAAGNVGEFIAAVGTAFTPTSGQTVTLQISAIFSADTNAIYEVLGGFSDTGAFDDQIVYHNGLVSIGLASTNVGSVAVSSGWNTYDLVMNFGTQTSSAYVNGQLIGAGAFAHPTARLGYATFGIDSNSDLNDPGNGYFDDLSVTSSAATVTPEPSSLVMSGTGLLGLAGAARRKFRRS